MLVLLLALANDNALTPKVKATDVLKTLFKVLKIADIDPTTCVNEMTGAGMQFRNFADEIETKNFTQAISSLNKGLSGLSIKLF